MRLTVNLRDDLYAVARSMARAESISISEAVNRLLQRALAEPRAAPRRSKNGLPVVRGRAPFGPDDVLRIESET
ncbi:MAG: hypothetical protein A2138_09265 [Deltaproteobacteria bacterium RBG_16_71_12]|nr:MAG: hypothetical protein A2138_09265 [Deltaproteobacteria bacterium RBG_16_71_12]